MSDDMGINTKAGMELFARVQMHNLSHHPTWDQNMAYLKAIQRVEREAAAATPSLPDEWLLSISIMEAARRIDLEMSVGHSWRELAMLTNAILADQYRAARLDEGSATPREQSDD